ncbi:MAG: hypothetical protein LBT22_06625 [Peptococcaceae bacterium]|jgi:Tfp pilus assembly protein PilX|nr:hypothetical protein [Peptococcaceae bacterium]
MMNNTKERRSISLNVGSATIIMLFVLLCLTVLSILSLLSANSQKQLADRAATVATNYYAAELKAAEIYQELLNGDFSHVEAEAAENGGQYFSYAVAIDENQTLSVRVRAVPAQTPENTESAALAIEYWKIIDAGDWTPDQSLGVLQGEETIFGGDLPFD